MILTGKAKEDFIEYYNNHSIKYLLSWTYFDDLPLVVKNALIIEWLDSVGIGVDSYTRLKRTNKLCWNADIIAEYDISNGRATINLSLNCKNRQEATEKAIKKANEIYNNL